MWLPFVFCYPKDGAALDNMCSAESAGEGKTRKGQPDTLKAEGAAHVRGLTEDHFTIAQGVDRGELLDH